MAPNKHSVNIHALCPVECATCLAYNNRGFVRVRCCICGIKCGTLAYESKRCFEMSISREMQRALYFSKLSSALYIRSIFYEFFWHIWWECVSEFALVLIYFHDESRLKKEKKIVNRGEYFCMPNSKNIDECV